MASTFLPTSRQNPCPICDKTSGNCRILPDKLLCMTFPEGGDDPSYRFIKPTKDRLWGIWVEDREQTWAQDKRDRWQREKQQREAKEQRLLDNALAADERDRQYRQLLSELNLHPDDRADLHRRGFADEQIHEWGIKSIVPGQVLRGEYSRNLPGIRWDKAIRSYCIIAKDPGYLCPAYDVKGRILGFQLRARDAKKNKYRWISSKFNPVKLGNGENPLAIFQPKQNQYPGIVFLCEGIGAKPKWLSDKLRAIVIGTAGGQFAASAKTLEQSLSILNEREKITIIQVPDAKPNPQVIRRDHHTRQLVKKLGYELQIAWWGQLDACDRDIDELSDEQFEAIEFISPDEFESFIQHQDQSLERILTLFRKRNRRKIKAKVIAAEKAKPADFEYLEGDRLLTWQKAAEQGYRYILDASLPGLGKSYDSGRAEPGMLDARQIIYASDQHRNPTVDTLDERNGWIDLEARHGGLSREKTADGGNRLKRSAKGESYSIAPNCNRNRLIGVLREKNIRGADTAALICGTCPLREACTHAEGSGYGFLHQRHSALSSPKLRAHPDSLPDPSDYGFEDCALIWDEPGQNFAVKRDIAITLSDLHQANSELMKHPELLHPMQEFLAVLLSYLDGSVKLGKFGASYDELRKSLPLPQIDTALLEKCTGTSLQFLNSSAQYGTDMMDLPPNLRKKFAEKDGELANQAEEQITKQWIPDMLRILKGEVPGASVRIARRLLIISLPDRRHREVAQAAKLNVFLDGTLNREDLALKIGCSPDEIFVCQQKISNHGNLQITQVIDLGRLGMDRGKQQQKRTEAIIKHCQQVEPSTKIIDYKKFEADGAHWRDSRGVNYFLKCKKLIIVGTPCRNLADLKAEYSVLTGGYPNEDDSEFKDFINRTIRAELIQEIHRLRSHRRSDEQLEVLLLTDFDLEILTHQVKASEITIDAESKREQFVAAVRKAASQVKDQGGKLTQTAIAAITGYSQQYISRHWKLLLSLLDPTNSKSSRPPEPDEAEQIQAIEQVLEAAIVECDTPQLLEVVDEVFFVWLKPRQWQHLWQGLNGTVQVRILEALLLTVPARELQELQEVTV